MADNIDSMDERKRYEWVSKYPPEARKIIFGEGCFLFLIFFISLFLIFAIWNEWLSSLLPLCENQVLTIKKYAYYLSSGMLGGITFGMKYFYRVVARGFWHIDRKPWRYMSPFIAMAVAFIVGIMIDASLITPQKPITTPAIISIGFLAGYFADEAVGKMYEIANVIFGKTATTRQGNGKKE